MTARLGGQDTVAVPLHPVPPPLVHTHHLHQQLWPPGHHLLVPLQAVDGEEEVGLQREGEVGGVPAGGADLSDSTDNDEDSDDVKVMKK